MPLPASLHGRTAIVTGGAMGIGQAIVQSPVARGVAVAIGDIADPSETPALVEDRGGTACRPDLAAGRM